MTPSISLSALQTCASDWSAIHWQKIKAVPGSHQVLVTLTEEPKRAAPKRSPQLFQGKSRQLTHDDLLGLAPASDDAALGLAAASVKSRRLAEQLCQSCFGQLASTSWLGQRSVADAKVSSALLRLLDSESIPNVLAAGRRELPSLSREPPWRMPPYPWAPELDRSREVSPARGRQQ